MLLAGATRSKSSCRSNIPPFEEKSLPRSPRKIQPLEDGDGADAKSQVNTSNEDAKSGCEPGEAVELATYISKECTNLELAGLMTIGAFDDPNPEPYFKALSECRSR